MKTKQLIWAGKALTGEGDLPSINFGVCVEGDSILASGDRFELHTRYPDASIVGGENWVLLPAMVNSHDHGRAISTVSLGVPDQELETWLLKLRSLPEIDPYLAAAYEGVRLLKSGVTTVAHSHNPRDWENLRAEAAATIQGYRDAGIRVAFHPPMVEQNFWVYDDLCGFLDRLPPELKPLAQSLPSEPPLPRSDYLALCTDLFNTYHDSQHHRVHIQVSPAGGQWCSEQLILEATQWAQKHQTKVQMHLLETRYQRIYAYRRWGKSFVRHLEEIGVLGDWLTCAHMVWVELEDLPLLAERGVGIAHNPSSNLRLRSGIAPVAPMSEAGIPLGIGLDGLSLDDDQDYLREMCLAWTLSNQAGFHAPQVDARTIWQMGTNGGVAITLGENVPLVRLAAGTLADLVLLELGEPMGSSSLESLLRCARSHTVKYVMVGGRWVVKDGRSQTLDEEEIKKALRESVTSQDLKPLQRKAAALLAPYLRRFYSEWER